MTTPQSTRTLPERPNLKHVKKQAKTLLAEYCEGTAEAIAEITRFERAPNPSTWGLHDAQRVLARAYGFSSWTKPKETYPHFESDRRESVSHRNISRTV